MSRKGRKDVYLVGYPSGGNVAYGKPDENNKLQWAEPLTLLQAKRLRKSLTESGDSPRIFKLVEVTDV